MKKTILPAIYLMLFSVQLIAQESITPTIEPETFDPKTEITITYDATGTALESLSDAYIWVWIPEVDIDAKYNVNPASSNSSLTDNAKFEKSTADGKTLFAITLVPEDFFSAPICIEDQLGMLIKGNDWSDGQSVDHVVEMQAQQSCFATRLVAPQDNPAFIALGGTLSVVAEASTEATFTLSVDGVQVDQVSSVDNYSFNYSVPQSEGTYPVALHIADTENDTTIAFSYLINIPSEEIARPNGVIPGINYDPADDSKVTLCLMAPGKAATYVLGEFNDFELSSNFKMNRDGDYFWIEVTGLTAGQEYAFQYLVDGTYVADPFAEKILDPDDFYIPESIYPDLKEYPQAARYDQWYKNRLSVLKTAQTSFVWQHNEYQKPEKSDLVIYELHMRDFFAEEDRNYKNLTDTLSYLKSLGVNAIELMPIQEFAGNNSWGYNPTFMFAPDKAYGTEEALKEFMDAAHGMGIAVILDIVFNQQDAPNPYVSMWFDYETFKVTEDNPMFNVDATHPFSVFFDMNHESDYTKYYMDTTLHYWINEYQVDGFRFDLSKGFTQKDAGGDVGAWNKYDQSRIDIIERMADKVWSYAPESFLVLEHLSDNDEETELADYGLMFWGNMHWDYKDLVLGVERDIAWSHHATRGWQNPNLIAYMESHDEQRLVYELLENGKANGSYNTKNLKTAIDRIKLASTFFYTIPGPKMLWQFGEIGYDLPINLCEDETTIDEGCRTSPKPLKWEYYEESERLALFKTIQALIDLKTKYDVFETGQFSMTDDNSLVKNISLINKDGVATPGSDSEMSVYIIGNFDLASKNVNMSLPFAGTWYDFFDEGEELNATETIIPISLNPGEFKIYVNYEIEFPEAGLSPVITGLTSKEGLQNNLSLYPNPSDDRINIEIPNAQGKSFSLEIRDMSGKLILREKRESSGSIDISDLDRGMYLLKAFNANNNYSTQFIKK